MRPPGSNPIQPHRRWVVRAVFFAGVIAAWELLARAQLWPDYLFPSASRVLAEKDRKSVV